MSKIKEGVDGRSIAESIAEAKSRLEAMVGHIPDLVSLELGVDFSATAASYDCVINSELESREALEVYNAHPVHVAVLAFMKTILEDRCLVDYEI